MFHVRSHKDPVDVEQTSVAAGFFFVLVALMIAGYVAGAIHLTIDLVKSDEARPKTMLVP